MESYKEHDVVKLVFDLPHRNLFKGDKGTIVYVYPNAGDVYEVEFLREKGTPLIFMLHHSYLENI